MILVSTTLAEKRNEALCTHVSVCQFAFVRYRTTLEAMRSDCAGFVAMDNVTIYYLRATIDVCAFARMICSRMPD